MTDFFRQVERIQMSIRKIESDTHVLQENFNERLVKINPADRRSKFIRRLVGLEITIWYVRQWISSSEANSPFARDHYCCIVRNILHRARARE
jgi:hypothetical protein